MCVFCELLSQSFNSFEASFQFIAMGRRLQLFPALLEEPPKEDPRLEILLEHTVLSPSVGTSGPGRRWRHVLVD